MVLGAAHGLVELTESHLDGVAAIEAAVSPQPWSRALFAGELVPSSAPRHWLVAVTSADREVIGFGGMLFVDGEAHLMNLAIAPEWQRRGIAGELLAALTADARARGIERFTLEVRASNRGAIALYEANGYVSAGRRPGYYQDGEDAVIMWADDAEEHR